MTRNLGLTFRAHPAKTGGEGELTYYAVGCGGLDSGEAETLCQSKCSVTCVNAGKWSCP